jgi:hypothetical protein
MTKSQVTSDSFTSSAKPSFWEPWLVGSFVAVVILLVALVLMKWSGLLDIPKDDTGTKTLAAALGLLGAILTAVVALVGTVVKYSIDYRSTQLAVDSEKRNRIQAAISAVALLSANNRDATPHQMGGVLLALTSLGEYDLAVSLLSQLWPYTVKSPIVANVVLEHALRAGLDSVKVEAVEVLLKHPDQIQQAGYDIWPLPHSGWNLGLPLSCRQGLIEIAAQWLLSTIEQRNRPAGNAVEVLYEALNDKDPAVHDIATACFASVVGKLPDEDFSWYSNSPDRKDLSVQTICERQPAICAHPPDQPYEATTVYGQIIQKDLGELLARMAARPVGP